MKVRYDPRIFLALTLSRTVQERMGVIQAEMMKYFTNWHFVPLINFHITLRFFGEVPEAEIPKISEHCERISPLAVPFSLHFTRLGFFGEPQAARVLYIGAEDNEMLSGLSHALWEAFPDEHERRRFHPHVTLAKARKQVEPHIARSNANMLQRLRDLGRVGPEPVDVDITTVHREFVLMETIWVGRDVEYNVRERYPFAAS
jgi:RNA 2',3'-cyclic 3'-phosphodiesterase